jgi:hypothetical protein
MPKSRSRTVRNRGVISGYTSALVICASERTRTLPAASQGSSGAAGQVSSMYSMIASDCVSCSPSCSNSEMAPCGFSAR